MDNKIICGDCIEAMKSMPENSVDAIITDPPYGLEFMGKEWDKFKKTGKSHTMYNLQQPGHIGAYKKKNFKVLPRLGVNNYELQPFVNSWAKACLRILKPGGFLLAMGGTRTYHRLTCGIEDAGFEIRDTIMWLYGSGFPKSLNIGKQVDKLQGNEREVVGSRITGSAMAPRSLGRGSSDAGSGTNKVIDTKGTSQWEGWGTALKPACEPIVVARKPLSEKNVALNVLKWGTGGINIDACRIEAGKEITQRVSKSGITEEQDNSVFTTETTGFKENTYIGKPEGRFPANIILDEEAGKMLDEQSGIIAGGRNKTQATSIFGSKAKNRIQIKRECDKGGASRFFYCAKASKSERNLGCDGLEPQQQDLSRKQGNPGGDNPRNRGVHKRNNNHPTVKPIKLMEYLVKLVSKPGATILDPFLGSGTTAIACIKLNRRFIGIEKEEEYIKIAEARIKPYMEQDKLI